MTHDPLVYHGKVKAHWGVQMLDAMSHITSHGKVCAGLGCAGLWAVLVWAVLRCAALVSGLC